MLESERLIEVASAEERWAEAAHGILRLDWSVKDIVAEEADDLRGQYMRGSITIDELRAGTAWANALDREAVQLHGADLFEGSQQEECTARRVMHLAGRSALDSLRSKRRRGIVHANNRVNAHGVGMGRHETHDIKDRSLVQ